MLRIPVSADVSAQTSNLVVPSIVEYNINSYHFDANIGFLESSVYWDDEDSNNANSHHGTLPSGVYDKNTRIYYCCR